MSATLTAPLEDKLRHLRRDYVTHGYVSACLNEALGEMQVGVDNIADLEQFAANLHLAQAGTWVNRYTGWYGEVWLVLVLDIPRGVHGRAA